MRQAAQNPAQDSAAGPAGPPCQGQEPRRGRPRSAAVERAILDAVVQLLEAGETLDGLSIERIARTAGVGKATIYRRWSGKEELFVDVLRDIEPPIPHSPEPPAWTTCGYCWSRCARAVSHSGPPPSCTTCSCR